MTSKLCILLLGLAALAAVIQAFPYKKLAKRESIDDLTREEFIEYLKDLSEDDVEEMSDDEKLEVVFAMFYHGISEHDLDKRSLFHPVKRSPLGKMAKRSLNKREIDTDGDDDLSREEFIHFLKNVTPEEIEKMTDEEKLGLVFLIYLFDVQAHELEKREAHPVKVFPVKVFAKRSLPPLAEEFRGDNNDNNDDDDDGDFSRESFIHYLRGLSEEDVANMTTEEKVGLLLLIHIFEVEPEELEK